MNRIFTLLCCSAVVISAVSAMDNKEEGFSDSTVPLNLAEKETNKSEVNAPRGKPRGITVDLKVEYKLRLPRIFLPLTFDVLLDNFFVNPNCRNKITI